MKGRELIDSAQLEANEKMEGAKMILLKNTQYYLMV